MFAMLQDAVRLGVFCALTFGPWLLYAWHRDRKRTAEMEWRARQTPLVFPPRRDPRDIAVSIVIGSVLLAAGFGSAMLAVPAVPF